MLLRKFFIVAGLISACHTAFGLLPENRPSNAPVYLHQHLGYIDDLSIGTSHHISFGHRLLVSQSIVTITSYPALATVLLINGGFYQLRHSFYASGFVDAWTQPPVWDYDPFFYNFMVHPYLGSMLYLSSRNRQGNMIQSFAIATIGSFSFEYIFESFNQRPSINDLILTPLIGSAAGELIYRVEKRMKRDNRLILPEKIFITAFDPMYVLQCGFRYREMVSKPITGGQ